MTVSGERALHVDAARVLLSHAVDYAGLFPPATLSMSEAVANYASYVSGDDAWALGRFVVPVERLQELEAAATPLVRGAMPWRVSALAGGDARSDASRVDAFNRAPGARLVIDVVEGRATTDADVAALAAAFPGMCVYVEIAPDGSLTAMIEAIGAAGLRAKLRTGGVVAAAFPTSRDVARFVGACVRRGVPFKATAGLHHPLRGHYLLTYAPDSGRATMFGFVNVFAAAALARSEVDEDALVAVLESGPTRDALIAQGHVRLGGHQIALSAIDAARREGAISFGSCSFREPVDELYALTNRR